MRLKHLPLLCSPITQEPLQLVDATMEGDVIKSGALSDGKNSWPIIDYIPRFVPQTDDEDSFSIQWKNHPLIMHQLFSGLTLYQKRFDKETKWGNKLEGQLILEAGCGVGSFTVPALETNATVVSFDISKGVETNYKLNGSNPNLLICQASILDMPFPAVFDKVFCFGVLQHTPDPRETFKCLLEKLKSNGKIATDVYADVPLTRHHGLLRTKYFLRKWTTKKDKEKLYKAVVRYVNTVYSFCQFIQRFPGGLTLSKHMMIDKYSNRLSGMKPEYYKEYAIIEIFDMLSPEYDNPQKIETFRQWHEDFGLNDIEVHYGYNGLEGRGTKP